MKKIKIGTKGTTFALWQAGHAQQQLSNLGVEAEIIIIHNNSGQAQDRGFSMEQMENALLRGEVDMAVHPLKDMPFSQTEGLVLAGVSQREDPSDWLLIRSESQAEGPLFSLKENAVVGACSARRKAQMLNFRKDILIKNMDGDLPAHIGQLRRGSFDALLAVGAGISRLGMDVSDLKVVKFNPREFIPAPAQGVLAYQCCAADLETRRLIKQIHHPEASDVTNVERNILKGFGGGHDRPLGAYCEQDANGHYHVWACFATAWDAPLKKIRLSSSTSFNLTEQIIERLMTND